MASKHGNHPFDWVEKGVKGAHRNPQKDILFELPTFSHFVRSVLGNGRVHTFREDQLVGDGALSTVFPHLDHLSSLKLSNL